MKRIIIRPISVSNVFFIFFGVISICLLIFLVIYMLMNFKDVIIEWDLKEKISYVFVNIVLVWLSIQSFYFSFKPNIQIKDSKLIVTFWKNGTPFMRQQTFLQQIKLPEVKIQTIELKNIFQYGKFLLKDIGDSIEAESGFNQEFYIKGFKMPEQLQGLQEIVLFLSKDKDIVAVNGEVYSNKQLEYLFGRLNNMTGILPSGRVTTMSNKYSFTINLVGSILRFLLGLFLILILPASTVYIEVLFNNTHIPSYDSGYRTLYVMSMMFANMMLLLFMSTFDKTYDEDKSVRKIRWISFLGIIILYFVFLISFYLSVNQ